MVINQVQQVTVEPVLATQGDSVQKGNWETRPHMLLMWCLHCGDLMPCFALEDVCTSAVHQHLVCIYSTHSLILFVPLPEGLLLLLAVWNTNPELHFHSHTCEPSVLTLFFFLPALLEQSGRDPGSPVYDVIFRKTEGDFMFVHVCGQGWYRT